MSASPIQCDHALDVDPVAARGARGSRTGVTAIGGLMRQRPVTRAGKRVIGSDERPALWVPRASGVTPTSPRCAETEHVAARVLARKLQTLPAAESRLPRSAGDSPVRWRCSSGEESRANDPSARLPKSPGASQIPEATDSSAFTPAAACWASGERLAPLESRTCASSPKHSCNARKDENASNRTDRARR